MSVSYNQARTEMFSIVKTRLLAAAVPSIVGSIDFREQGKPNPNPISTTGFTARLVLKTVDGRQSAFVADGKRQFTTDGLIFVSIFSPLKVLDYIIGGDLAQAAKTVLEKSETSSNVWFRNVRINELDEETANYGWNVVAEFTYDTINA